MRGASFYLIPIFGFNRKNCGYPYFSLLLVLKLNLLNNLKKQDFCNYMCYYMNVEENIRLNNPLLFN